MLGLGPAAADGQQLPSAAAQQLPPHLQELVLQVVAGLGSAARGAAAAAGLTRGEAETGGVLTPVNELDFWAQLASGPQCELLLLGSVGLVECAFDSRF